MKTTGTVTLDSTHDLRLDGGRIQNGGLNNTTVGNGTVAGKITLLTGGGIFDANTSSGTLDRTLDIQSTIGGSGALTLTGGGSGGTFGLITLSGGSANTYTGGTTINYIKVRLGKNNALGSSSGALNLNNANAVLDLNNRSLSVGALSGVAGAKISSDVAGTMTLTAGNGGTGSTYAGTIQNGHASAVVNFTQTGGGTQILSGANSYTGATTVSGGILEVSTLADGGSNSNIGASSNAAANLVLNGGTLAYKGAAVSTNRLFSVGTSGGTLDASGTGAVNFTNAGSLGFNSQTGSRLLTLQGSNAGNNTLAAVIGDNSGATSLTKSGAGKWILTGVNTYTGVTTISAGTLVLSGGGSIAHSAVVDVQAGATLQTSGVTFGSGQTVQGKGTIQGNTVIQGTLAPGSSPGILSFEDDLTLDGSNSVFEIQNTGLVRGTDYDGVNVGGLLTYGGTLTLSLTTLVGNGTYDLFAFSIGNWDGNFTDVMFSGGIYTGTFAYDGGSQTWKAEDTGSGQSFVFDLASGDLIIAAIPESSSALLFAAGLMATLFLRRRARN